MSDTPASQPEPKPPSGVVQAGMKLGTLSPGPDIPPDTVVRRPKPASRDGGSIWSLRRPISKWLSIALGLLCIVMVFGLWWYITKGEGEERIISPNTLRSPAETFAREQIDELLKQPEADPEAGWTRIFRPFNSMLARNLFASLERVVLGFLLAAVVGIPLGVLCGCFPWFNSFLAPINVFGRNIPIAALIPLTFAIFGIGELQKVMFIFIAAVAFIMMDTASAVADVSSRYIDTAYTLGASRRQIVMKVLVPLAMPRVFNSLRLLFGLAFGYIMLVESVTIGETAGGIGRMISMAQRRGHLETIYLILLIIPAVALAIDRLLYMTQKSLFPYQYASNGFLYDAWRGFVHALEDLKQLVIKPRPLDPAQKAALTAARSSPVTTAAKPS
jgi:NitT/TauT family transport system permease protein